MNRRRGSWPGLLAFGLLFAAAFAWQIHRSTFLRIEAETAFARPIAQANDLPLAEVLALADLLGGPPPPDVWRAAAERFAGLRAELGAPLAAVAFGDDGHGALVRGALAAAGGDRDAAWHGFRLRPEALRGLRFVAMRERFGARIEPQH